jgi:hypothetical protein
MLISSLSSFDFLDSDFVAFALDVEAFALDVEAFALDVEAFALDVVFFTVFFSAINVEKQEVTLFLNIMQIFLNKIKDHNT